MDKVMKETREKESIHFQPRLSFDRRTFLQVFASGIAITVVDSTVPAQSWNQEQSMPLLARLYLDRDGKITALSGKIEEGQGARAELSQAAAEELSVPVDRVQLVMADTDQVPDDGITAGSRTTPRNVPAMRQAAATARFLLINIAAERWNISAGKIQVREGSIQHPDNGRVLTYAELAGSDEVAAVFKETINPNVAVTPESDWDILVLLNKPNVDLKTEQEFRHHIFDLELEIGESISIYVHSKEVWEEKYSVTPWYKNVSKEGIALA
jgi:hypothetical protein